MPQIFRAHLRKPSQRVVEPKRSSPRERGYDAAWDRLSKDFRKWQPFCRFCLQENERLTFADVVDHIIPVVDRPDLLMRRENLQSLCSGCHGGTKSHIEELARKQGDLELLKLWCSDPVQRPKRLGDVR